MTFTALSPFDYPTQVGDVVYTSNPSTLVQGTDGNFYGVCEYGGDNVTGSIFKLTPAGTLTTLYSFGSSSGTADGRQPVWNLVQARDGEFYGTASSGGANNVGVVFKISAAGDFQVIHTFGGSDGLGTPNSPLTIGADGNFYGTAGDVIYRITPAGAVTKIYAFDDTHYPNDASGQIVFDSAGNLYGTTQFGGANNLGDIYKLSPSGALTVLYTFAQINSGNVWGTEPTAGLTLGRDGDLYGAADKTFFKITPDGQFTTLYSTIDTYGGPTTGLPLLLGSDGNFYGTATPGSSDDGLAFQLTPAGQFTTLYTFQGASDGAEPISGLCEATNGLLYGADAADGAHDDGELFTLSVPGLTNNATRFDFNADGHADLVWHNITTGDVSVWDTNDQQVLSYGASFAQVAPSSGWTPVACPDVNDDGYPDLLWWNSITGELSFWTLNGASVAKVYGDFATIADTNWKPVAAADVTGTTWELIFQNTATGDISAWQMNRRTVTSYGATLASLGANSPYQVVGAPDLDGDGKSDLLFWNSQIGGVSYWSCNLANSQVLAYHGDFTSLGDTTWHLVGSEDTNGDGHPDLLWWNAATGEVSRWLLNGTTVTSYGGDTAQVQDTTWQPTAIR